MTEEEKKERKKAWQKTYREKHKEALRISQREWHKANPERSKDILSKSKEKRKDKEKAWRKEYNKTENRKASVKRYIEKNKEILRVKNSIWKSNNKEKVSATSAKRRAALARAIPSWANLDAIEKVYEGAARLSEKFNVLLEVDHAVPLISDLVCGLHCEANLQILERGINRKKSNIYWPDMPDKD